MSGVTKRRRRQGDNPSTTEEEGRPTAAANDDSATTLSTSLVMGQLLLALFFVSVGLAVSVLLQPRSKSISVVEESSRAPVQHVENRYGYDFPEDFVWGVATSSYQIEGAANEDGRGPTVWDVYAQKKENILDHSDGRVACDHYHRVESDVALMKSLNVKAYRFSIAWSRILPNGTAPINQLGIDFYNRLIDTLLANDIEPWITLFHWDLPIALEDHWRGWLNERTATAFADYARICFDKFGDRVKHWITINEGWTVAAIGYASGVHAPGKQSPTEPYIAGHNLLLAHARAVLVYRNEFLNLQKGMIGIANSGDFRYPLQPNDQETAERAMLFQLGWFTDPIFFGQYPSVMIERLGNRLPVFSPEERRLIQGSADFIGLNYYSSQMAATPSWKPSDSNIGYWVDMYVETSRHPKWGTNAMDWNVVPAGLGDMLRWMTHRYDSPLIFITENGSAEDDKEAERFSGIFNDEGRRAFFEGHLRACGQELEEKEDKLRLGGYFAWSFMDNFEWQFGYSRRFGICHVDFETQVRTPRLSAKWYRNTIQANGRNIPRKPKETWSLPISTTQR